MSSAAKKSCSILICRSMWKRCGSSCRAWSASRKEFTSRGCRRFRRKLETAGRPVRTFTLDDMEDPAPEHYGLSGSPTQVKRIFPPENTNTHESWEGSGDELAERLRRFLDDRKFLQQLR